MDLIINDKYGSLKHDEASKLKELLAEQADEQFTDRQTLTIGNRSIKGFGLVVGRTREWLVQEATTNVPEQTEGTPGVVVNPSPEFMAERLAAQDAAKAAKEAADNDEAPPTP
jgi:hypothetical protein